MSYTKTVWENLPSTSTPINATNLNKIENQLELMTEDIQYPTYTNGSDYSTTRKSAYFRNGHFCTVIVNAKGLTVSAYGYKELFTLPTGYRPLIDTFTTATSLQDITTKKLLYVETNGTVTIQSVEAMSNGSVNGSITFYVA